jgi:hypothetical protein
MLIAAADDFVQVDRFVADGATQPKIIDQEQIDARNALLLGFLTIVCSRSRACSACAEVYRTP